MKGEFIYMITQTEKQRPLIQQILILALPIIMENLLQALLGTVDVQNQVVQVLRLIAFCW